MVDIILLINKMYIRGKLEMVNRILQIDNIFIRGKFRAG